MNRTPKKRFFSKHAKSSAAIVSLGIHAILVVIAVSFVAVTVIQKEEKSFEAKPVSRPKMNLKKLQVPVKIKKKKVQKPKLRKRIVVQPKLNQSMPDIKMPEISGVKGGMGSFNSGGLGGSGNMGFSMPEINLFGVKSKGEKVFLVLDSSSEIMSDERGGIPAYTLIKEELVRIIDDLPPTTLFNIAVYERYTASMLFPQLVAASNANIEKIKVWLDPLNSWHEGMSAGDYGIKTLGSGGHKLGKDLLLEPIKSGDDWLLPVAYAMKQQADAIFVLGAGWGHQYHRSKTGVMSPSLKKKMDEYYKKAAKLYAEENAERMKKGEPPRVLADRNAQLRAYFPDVKFPSGNVYYYYTPAEITDMLKTVRLDFAPKTVQSRNGLRKKPEKVDYTLNVIQFMRKSGDDASKIESFKKLANLNRGRYRTITGLEGIESVISRSKSDDKN